jgi:hypothetical protein
MKKQIILLVVVATFACCSVSRADIIGASWNLNDCTNVTCSSQTFASGTLNMNGVQHASLGLMEGTITTDTIGDPTLYLGSGVNNDTGGAWIGYQVNVVMSTSFTYAVTPSVSTIPSDTWFLASSPTTATLQGPGPYAGLYESTFAFSEGTTPVGIGEELDFNYAINFAGSTDYAFTQEMIPMFSVVPEPSTVALLAIGGLGLALRLRRNSRKGA